jgi:ABC-type antimicrobial peptide transport system permease subunit
MKTRRSPADAASAIEREIASARIALRRSLTTPTTLEATIGGSYIDDTIRMQATALFAAIALLLVVVGIYGLMSYAVTRRSHEIGVRMTIGATPAGILRLIVGECLLLVGIGVLAGLPRAMAVMRALSAYSFQVSSFDAVTIAGAVLMMGVTAGLAAARPVWRATRVDPVETLRAN